MTNHSYQITDGKSYFNAKLKGANNRLYEIGFGSASPESKTVDFFNEFVPLMPFRSTAKIVKVIGEQECHCFEGKVYLSSKTRLQLTDVTDSFITHKELEIPQKVQISASISSAENNADNQSFPIDIFSLSIDEVHFTAPKQFNATKHIILKSNDDFIVDNVMLCIYKELQFSDEKAVYYAAVEHCPIGCQKTFFDFLAPKLILFPSKK